MRVLFACLAASLFCALVHAAPPSWVVSAAKNPDPALAKDHVLVILLRDKTLSYLEPGKVHTRVRGLVKLMRHEGQDAVVASHSFNTDSGRILESRGWLLDERGKVLRTLNKGSFTEYSARSDNRFWDSQRTVRCSPGSELPVGGYFAWEFVSESTVGVFDQSESFQPPHPVVHHRFSVTPAPGTTLVWNAYDETLGQPTLDNKTQALVWDFRGLSPLPKERPGSFLPCPRLVSVRCVLAAQKAPPSWPEICRSLYSDIAPKLAPDPTVQAKATALSSGLASRWERIRALCTYVQKEISYLSITAYNDYLAGCRPHAPAEVISSRYGDCKDKAALLVALLEALGEKAWMVVVNSSNPALIQEDWSGLQFNHAIVGIVADEETPDFWPKIQPPGLPSMVLFDPTSTQIPLGALPAGDRLGHVLVLCPEGVPVVRVPPSVPSQTSECVDSLFDLSADASMQGKTLLTSSGEPGARLAQLHGQRGMRSVLSAIEADLAGSGLALQLADGVLSWDPAKGEATLQCSASAQRCLRRVGPLQLFQPFVTVGSPPILPWKNKDLRGWSVRQGREAFERSRWKLPASLVVEELPDAAEDHSAYSSFKISYHKEGDSLVAEARLMVQGALLDRDAYESERAFLRRVLERLRRPVVLRQP